MEKVKKKTAIILFLIILFGAFLRFYRLTQIPPSLFGDEVDVGYQAYSILKTGKDYMGQPWPISFHSLADWRTPLFLYAAVPSIAIFGLNELGVRFPPAFFGVLGIFFFFLLVKQLFKNEKLALLAAFFLAISPWHLQYSRAAYEVTMMLSFLFIGLYFFFYGLENKSRWSLPLSALFLALMPYIYNTAKFFTPIFILVLIAIFFDQLKKIKRNWLIAAILILFLMEIPLVYDILFGQGGSRFGYLSIFNNPTTVPEIGFRRLEDLNVKFEEIPLGISPNFSSRFFHNKFLSWGITFLDNYFRAFSTEFLFTFGDINYRHSIQGGFGELYWLDMVFLILGILYIVTKLKDKKIKNFLLAWLLISPIASALTKDGGNHATRLILMLPILLIFISFGFFQFLTFFLKSKKQKVLAIIIISVFYILNFSLYIHRYYVHWPIDSQYWWHPGWKEAGLYVKKHENEYNQIVWSTRGEPPTIFFLFWTGFDPAKFQKAKFEDVDVNSSIEARHLIGTKYYFGSMNEEYAKHYNYTGALTPKILYIASQAELKINLEKVTIPAGLKVVKIIDLPNRDPGMYLLSGQ